MIKAVFLNNRDPEQKQMDWRRNDAEDLLVVQETLRGSKQAFTSIVERYTPLLYSVSYRMLGNSEEAEEAVQEVFLKAYRSLQKFRISSRFHPWLYTIAMNHLRSLLRKRGRSGSLKIIPLEEKVIQDKAHSWQDPALLAVHGEGENLAAEAIQGLRQEYREVFLLRKIEGLSVKEVSEILELPEGTVKTYLHRARRQLIDFLAEKDWE